MKRWPGECADHPNWISPAVIVGRPTAGNPVNLGSGFVTVAPEMPTRRVVSVEEFETGLAEFLEKFAKQSD